MANEIVPSGIGDLVAAEVIANEFLYLLADRDGSILSHPALLHVTGAPHSTVIQVPHIGLAGTDLLSATTPGSEIANTALSDGSTDVTLAMRAKRYNVDDLAEHIAAGKLSPQMIAMDAAISVAQTLISLIANVADDFTSTAGSSGVDATWSNVQAAKALLSVAKVQGPLCAILHPVQWADLEADALSLGALPAMTMSGVINQNLGSSYKGSYMGIDFYTSSAVPTADAGANRAGAVFGLGGIAWADAMMSPQNDPNVLDLGRARIERVRQGHFAATSWVISHVAGVSKAIDAAGVTLKTDA